MNIISKGRARWKRGPVTVSEKSLGIKDAKKRRRVLYGFPRPTKLQTEQEITDYFSGDKLTCLMCGHEHKTLTTHLKWCHSMTNQDYKERFGLPLSRGLYGVGTREIFANFARTRLTATRITFEKGVCPYLEGRKRPLQPYELDRMSKHFFEKGEKAKEHSNAALAKRWGKP
jgi:hypothetical protein